MTIVFKYGGETTLNPAELIDSTGVSCWATVALPYNYSKNLPDFMIFEVTYCDPRTPTNRTLPEAIPVGSRFPAYRLRQVGGPNEVPNIESDTDLATFTIPPHSEIWAVSANFPPFAANNPAVHIEEFGNRSLAYFRRPRGLNGELVYPTNSDILNFSNLGFPTTVQRGPNTFMGTGYPRIDNIPELIFQYEVSCSDFNGVGNQFPWNQAGTIAGIAGQIGINTIAAARLNQRFYLPLSKDLNNQTNPNSYIVDLLEESTIRKVIRVRATRPIQGFNIWTYYYLYAKSPIVIYSTRIHWSDRENIPGETGPNKNPGTKRVHQIFACHNLPFQIIRRDISNPRIFASPIRRSDIPTTSQDIGVQDEAKRPVILHEDLRTWPDIGSLPVVNDITRRPDYYIPVDPDNSPTLFQNAVKVLGDEEMGTTVYLGPNDPAAAPTKAITVKTTRQRWLQEGSGHYYYGIITDYDDTDPNAFKWRDYCLFSQLDYFGPPEGTYIWTGTEC